MNHWIFYSLVTNHIKWNKEFRKWFQILLSTSFNIYHQKNSILNFLFETSSQQRDFFPGGASSKESSCHCRDPRDMGSISGSGGSPGEGNGNPLQCSCLENSMDRGAWWATVHGVAKSQTQLSMHTHTHLRPVVSREISREACTINLINEKKFIFQRMDNREKY